MASKLARHEAAQRASRILRERCCGTTLSFSTKEVMDYLWLSPTGPVVVEIKTGKARLKPRQKAWCANPPMPTIVEYWSVTGGAPPILMREDKFGGA